MKIAILTTFQEFNPGYSLTGIVEDQVTMLSRHGHDVHLFVSEKFTDKGDSPRLHQATIHKKVPFSHLVDYEDADDLSDEHFQVAERFCNLIANEIVDFDFIYTHDMIFTGWNLPYARGIYEVARRKEVRHIRWLHWIHSIPSLCRNWWNIKMYGPAHRIVYPNKSNQINAASQFHGDMEHVKIIPHIKDLRSWFDFHPDTWAFFDEFPTVMQSEITQVYPAGSDRLAHKRVDVLIKMFAYLKKKGKSVSLIIANQWATGRQPKENIDRMMKLAVRNGLRRNEDIIFTSDWEKRFENGIPKRILREIMLCCNLFIYPTREESFGLVGPESALSGAKLMVLNKSLAMQMEVHGMTGLYCDFGSFEQEFDHPDLNAYYSDLASLIIAKMNEDDAIQAATHHRLKHNMDYLYYNYYEPLMQEGKIWAVS